eukprot:Colp12_sorted_trinity150504_noHs@7832
MQPALFQHPFLSMKFFKAGSLSLLFKGRRPMTTIPRMATHTLTPSEQMLKMICGNWISQSIYAVSVLGIADKLHYGPQTTQQLAKATGVHETSLNRLLRGLASVDVFVNKDNTWHLTPLGQTLRSDAPDSMKAYAIKGGSYFNYEPWAHVLDAVKTGEPVFKNIFGKEIWEYMGDNEEANKIYNESMKSFSGNKNEKVVSSFDFSVVKSIVDVGGGNGSFSRAIMSVNPHINSTVFDLPHVVAETEKQFKNSEFSSRLQFASGDMFESVPKGADAYVLRHIIHDHNEENCKRILKSCYDAMRADSKLLLVEMVIPDDNEYFYGKLLDLQMMVIYSGRERTAEEYRQLLSANGFSLSKIYPSGTTLSIVEAIKM